MRWRIGWRRRGGCCSAWKYITVGRLLPMEGIPDGVLGFTEELGAYGADDAGTIYHAHTLLQRNAKREPMKWDEWDARRERDSE